MKCNSLIGLTILAACLIVSIDADAARPNRIQAVVADPEYRNKPIAGDATVWYCSYDGKQSISCRLGDPGRRFALPMERVDPRLPTLIHDIWNSPQQLAGRRLSIPLHSVPFDFEMVGRLAESVMCGNRDACGVIFASNLSRLEPLVRAFEHQRHARRDHATVGPIAAAN